MEGLQKTGEFRASLIGMEECALCGLASKSISESTGGLFVPFTPQLWVEEQAIAEGKFVKNRQRFICVYCYAQILRDYLITAVHKFNGDVQQRPPQE